MFKEIVQLLAPTIVLAIGVFMGNWLVVPLLTDRTHTDGFWIGVIAAILILIFGGIFLK